MNILLIVMGIVIAYLLYRQQTKQHDLQTLKILQDTLLQGSQETRLSVKEALSDYAQELGKRVDQMNQMTETRLKEINQQVEKRLSDGFEKTTATFSDIVKRLALIDAAQKQIGELSGHVVNLNDIFF